MTYATTYDFAIAKDWWGITELPLCSRVDKNLMVCAYRILFHHANIALVIVFMYLAILHFSSIYLFVVSRFSIWAFYCLSTRRSLLGVMFPRRVFACLKWMWSPHTSPSTWPQPLVNSQTKVYLGEVEHRNIVTQCRFSLRLWLNPVA